MDIAAFLKALAAASTNSFAFVSYVTVVFAWLLIALRVRRNKNLLNALDKIPANQRLAALQAEMGNVAPPEGLTPQQWLRSKVHAYYFLAFLVLCFCLTVLAVVAYGSRPDDPRRTAFSEVSLFVDNSARRQSENETEPNVLRYATSRKADGTENIYPTMPYLVGLDSNQELHGFQYWHEPFDWAYPSLSIKIVNNSKSTLFVSEIQFDVSSADLNLTPIPLIHEDFYNIRTLQFVNEGWGGMQAPILEIFGWKKPELDSRTIVYNWVRGHSTQDPCHGSSPLVGQQVSLKLQTIDENISVPVARYVPTNLKKEPLVCAVGVLSYTVPDSSERRAFRFRSIVSQFNPGPGAPAPPSATYDLFLPAGKKGYVAVVPVSQAIKPGDTDHFLIRVASDKSATFKLRYRAKVVSNIVIGEQSLELKLFIPRSGATRGGLDRKNLFLELPVDLWGGLPQSKHIARIVYDRDNKSDIQVFLKTTFTGDATQCREYYNWLIGQLRNSPFPFPPNVEISIVDARGVMFCQSGIRSLTKEG